MNIIKKKNVQKTLIKILKLKKSKKDFWFSYFLLSFLILITINNVK